MVVEAYTRGLYMTADVDYALSDPVSEVAPVLENLGFKREGRAFYHPDADLVVEFPGRLETGEMSRLVTVEIDGLEVSLLSLEDIISDRVSAARQWQDRSSREWARRLILAYRDRLDLGLLEAICREHHCADEFHAILASLEPGEAPPSPT